MIAKKYKRQITHSLPIIKECFTYNSFKLCSFLPLITVYFTILEAIFGEVLFLAAFACCFLEQWFSTFHLQTPAFQMEGQISLEIEPVGHESLS